MLVVLGLNHNTAPVSVREKIAIKKEDMKEKYSQLLSYEEIQEVLLISTCNRVEYYFVIDKDECDKCDMVSLLCSRCNVLEIISKNSGLEKKDLLNYTYFISGNEAITHIFSVASGLDSLVLGEPQILGQVKDAIEYSKEFGGMGKFLHKLSDFTIKTAKKVRTQTGISENPVSVSYAAVELAKNIFENLSEARALIIGAGEMCELAARHLVGSNIGKLTITNRTLSKAEALADELNGDIVPFHNFQSKLSEVDIIISSTGSESFVLTYDMVKSVMGARKGKPMFFIDIAVPRDIDPKIGEFDNTYVYDIDDLKHVVEANKKEREKEAKKAWEIIYISAAQFGEQLETLKVTPIIKDIRLLFESKKNEELARFCEKNNITDEKERLKLEYLLTATLNKIMHTPITNLKEHALDTEQYSITEAIQVIFKPNNK